MTRTLQAEREEYDDCGEINRTLLAENAADALDLAGTDNEATIPEEVFDLAHEVATKFEESEEDDE